MSTIEVHCHVVFIRRTKIIHCSVVLPHLDVVDTLLPLFLDHPKNEAKVFKGHTKTESKVFKIHSKKSTKVFKVCPKNQTKVFLERGHPW